MNNLQLDFLKEQAKAQGDEKLMEVIEQAEKYQQIKEAWEMNQDKETIFFIRECKKIIEEIEIPKRKKMV